MTPRLAVALLATLMLAGCAATLASDQQVPIGPVVNEGGNVTSRCAATTPGFRIWSDLGTRLAITPDPTCHPDTGKEPR